MAARFSGFVKQISVRTKTPLKELAPLLAELVAAGRILALGGRLYLHADTAGRVRQQLLDLVRNFHRQRPESPGIAREQLMTEFSRGEGVSPLSSCREGILASHAGSDVDAGSLKGEAKMASRRKGGTPSPLKKEVFDALIEQLRSEGKLVERKGCLALPEHREQFNNAEQQLLDKIESMFKGRPFDPPGLQEVADKTRASLPQVQRVVRILIEQQRLVRVEQDLYFHAEAVATARERLIAYIKEHNGLESVQFKYVLNTTRKYAIPLLDFFDKIGLTRRVGYTRLLK